MSCLRSGSLGACSEIARLIGRPSPASCRMRAGTPTVEIVIRRAPRLKHFGSCRTAIARITFA
jgi:hypothetical protein